MKRSAVWSWSALLLAGTLLPTAAWAQTITRVEDTHPALRYNSSESWLNRGDANASGRTMSGAYAPGSSVSVAFRGTGISWIGYRCRCASGIARLYVDGTLVDTVDTYASTPEMRAKIYSVSGLPNREHVFTIEATGDYERAGDSAYVYVDAFDITGEVVTPSDDTAPQVRVTAPRNLYAVSGTITLAAEASDDIRVAGVSFLVDGEPLGTEDAAAPYAIDWKAGGDGPRVLTAVARDWMGNTTSSAPVVVRLTDNGLIEESDPAVSYYGEWYDVDDPDFSGGSAMGSYIEPASVKVEFEGTGISWIGYRCACASGVARVSIDGKTPRPVFTYGPGREPQAEVYRVSGLPDARHELTIQVTSEYDVAGDSGYVIVDAFRVERANSSSAADTVAPTLTLSGPANGAFVRGTVSLSARASDDRDVVGVKFYANGMPIGDELRMGPSWSRQWDTAAYANGNYTLTAIARDAAGNIAVASVTDLAVFNTQDTGKPRVKLTSPADGARITGTVTLSATASDNREITAVRFMAGDLLIGEVTSPPWSITRDTSRLPNGSRYVLTAQAIDAAGNVGISPVNAVTVQHGTGAP